MHSTAQIEIFRGSKFHGSNGLIRLASLIAAINAFFHFGLWQFHVWTPFALTSLLLFVFVWLQYKKEQQLLITDNHVQIIKLLESSGFNKVTHHFKKKAFKKDFIRSRLYDNLPFTYMGNHLLKAGNWFISNITVFKQLDKSKEAAVVFDGVFAKIKTETKTDGYLIIKPVNMQGKEAVPEVLKKLIHRYFTPKAKSTSTGNKLFDERFDVYANPQNTQKKVLKKRVSNKILELHETIRYYFVKEFNGLEISFVENYIYIGIKGVKLFDENNNNTFNAALNQKYIELIKLIVKIKTL